MTMVIEITHLARKSPFVLFYLYYNIIIQYGQDCWYILCVHSLGTQSTFHYNIQTNSHNDKFYFLNCTLSTSLECLLNICHLFSLFYSFNTNVSLSDALVTAVYNHLLCSVALSTSSITNTLPYSLP